jgi:hypothetical protein
MAKGNRTLSDSIEFLTAIHKTFVKNYSFQSNPDLREIINEPRTIIVTNHATPLSWIPVMTTLSLEFYQSGGGHRTPRGIVDRWFYSNPFTQPIAEFLTQSDRPLNFDQIIESFVHSTATDLVISPEGANTFFGNVHEVQEFRSHRYLEIAVRAQCPILLVSHKGSESWCLPIALPKEVTPFVKVFSDFFGTRLEQFGKINLPLPPHQIESFKVKCQLYHPKLKIQDLPQDKNERKDLVTSESLQIKDHLSQMLSEI